MLTVNDALEIILESMKSLPEEEVRLTEALDRVLSEDVFSSFNIPLFDNSAMDGYAVRSFDTSGSSKESPQTLRIIDNIQAGISSEKILNAKQAIKIMTGAPLPKGSDAVIMAEKTQAMASDDQKEESVQIFHEAKPWENIRRAGENVKKDELVIEKGTWLNPAHIGMLASLGKPSIKVSQKPRAAILATGDELIGVEEELTPGKLYSSNSYALYSQVKKFGGIPVNLGVAKDDPAELEKKIREGLDCDMIITSGGVSVGDYDFVKPVLEKMGMDVKFWKVAMKPGKPVLFGVLGNIPVFGLPGNPVSCMVNFEIFVGPAILKILGGKENIRKEVEAVLCDTLTKRKDLRYFMRARTIWNDGGYLTRTTGPQGSGILKSMVQANSFIVMPEEVECIEKGSKVKVRFLE